MGQGSSIKIPDMVKLRRNDNLHLTAASDGQRTELDCLPSHDTFEMEACRILVFGAVASTQRSRSSHSLCADQKRVTGRGIC